MQSRFPNSDELWRRQVEQLLMELVVDRDRLMKNSPQVPDPEAGISYTGPLSPANFAFRGGGGPVGSGSAPLSGGTGGTNQTGGSGTPV